MLLMSIEVFGFESDYFLFDLEKNTLNSINGSGTGLVECTSLPSLPEIITKTNHSNELVFLLIPTETVAATIKHGCVMLYNPVEGLKEIAQFGYTPYKYVFSEDRKHLVVSCQTENVSDEYEIVVVDLENRQVKKALCPASNIVGLEVASVSNEAYVLCGIGHNKAELFTLDLDNMIFGSPLVLDGETHMLGNKYLLVNEEIDWSAEIEKIINNYTENTKFTISRKISLVELSTQKTEVFTPEFNGFFTSIWDEKNKVLIYATQEANANYLDNKFQYNGIGYFYHVSNKGFKEIVTPLFWDFSYCAEQERLYALLNSDIFVYDLRSGNSKKYRTGQNTYQFTFREKGNPVAHEVFKTTPYFINVFPKSETALIYNSLHNRTKLFDLRTNKVIGVTKDSPDIEEYKISDDNMIVAADKERKLFYVMLNKRSDTEITVYNRKFRQISTINIPEPLIDIYQLDAPVIQPIVVTNKSLYTIQGEKLVVFYESQSSIEKPRFFIQKDALIFLTDEELCVFDLITLELKSNRCLWANEDEEYNNIESTDKRYIFVPMLGNE